MNLSIDKYQPVHKDLRVFLEGAGYCISHYDYINQEHGHLYIGQEQGRISWDQVSTILKAIEPVFRQYKCEVIRISYRDGFSGVFIDFKVMESLPGLVVGT